MQHFFLGLAVVIFASAALAGQTDRAIEDGRYADDATASKAWQALGGTAPARRGEIGAGAAGARPVMILPCNFAGTNFERATWDRTIKLDLLRTSAIEIDLFCKDPTPVSHFSLYLKSGSGWYAAQVRSPVAGQWTTARLTKEGMKIEGTPAGWGRIEAIRLSAWRGADRDTEIALGAIRPVAADDTIILVRNESSLARNPKDEDSVRRYPESLAHELSRVGLDCLTVGDQDLPNLKLENREIVVLPYAPDLSKDAQDVLARHMEQGGKVLAFYILPEKLAAVMGVKRVGFQSAGPSGRFSQIRPVGEAIDGMPAITKQKSWNINRAAPVADHPAHPRTVANWFDAEGSDTKEPAVILSDRGGFMTHVLLTDDRENQLRLFLTLAGKLQPEVWNTVRQHLSRAIQAQENEILATTNDALGRIDRDAQLKKLREAYQAACADVRKADISAGRALDRAQEARKLLLEIYARLQPSALGEQRGFWCHSAFGPREMGWDKAIKAMADNGFNAIFPNMLWGGVGYYRSEVLPVAPEVAEEGDQIELCLAACRKYGVKIHVWKVNWNMGWRYPKEFGQRVKREGRTQVKFDGTPEDRWLCPSHPENRKLEIDSMVEVARKYAVDGIHFDYIRYPGDNQCFCAGCRERFEKILGQKAENWPASIRKDAELRRKWNDFRRENISAVVEAVSREARKARPGILISAAVFPNWATDRDSVAQDWKMWCEKGWLDFVCPMDYTPHDSDFANQVKRQVEWAGKTPVYPGIGLSVWPDKHDIVGLTEKIKLARQAGCKGFTIFEYQSDLAGTVLPMMRLGPTKE